MTYNIAIYVEITTTKAVDNNTFSTMFENIILLFVYLQYCSTI